MTEEVVLSWVRDDRGVPKEDLLMMLAAGLPAILRRPAPDDAAPVNADQGGVVVSRLVSGYLLKRL